MARAKTSKKQASATLLGQTDPRAPLDGLAFLKAAQPVVKRLGEDLLNRAKASKAVQDALLARHTAERAARRTAEDFPGWQRQFVEQVAAAWLLSCVFVRTLEDRGLLGHARIAGPGALDGQRLFLEMSPNLTEREYLLTVFRELSRLPAGRDLFDARHNPVWLLGPSAEGAKLLLNLFREPSADAPLYRFGQPDTRFLGDLYQDLNEDVQKRFALLQTPRFVESFILDRTLTHALDAFGVEETTLIDPTCGSGHFLLGAFERLFEARLLTEPALGERSAAKKALEAVAGADINPYAVAIAKFRLTLAFLEKAGFGKLSGAPELPLRVVVADSLLHKVGAGQLGFDQQAGQSAKVWRGEEFALEDEEAAKALLGRRYAVVVGNPPYIVPKDDVLRGRYRELYVSASMQYSLGAPFTERFFQLAKDKGYVGMITANSFMKREFGKKLIQEFLPKVNLNLIVNTSGAYIPGHGTPTVLLFGTNEPPLGTDLSAVLANRGEPGTPENPEDGLVWRSIADHWREEGFENEYISVTRPERKSLAKHPWSLGGGGASELKELIEQRGKQKLQDVIVSCGRVAHTGNDEAFVASEQSLKRRGLSTEQIAQFVEGEALRDWAIGETTAVVFAYERTDDLPCMNEEPDDARIRWLWPYRSGLWERREPNGTHKEIGLTWYEFSRFHPERFVGTGIAFAFVATHNHFVLDRGGKVFNRSAPIIKLPATATEDDHFALLAYLNSSTACFWMKQVTYAKASASNDASKEKMRPEAERYEFASAPILPLPLPPLQATRVAQILALAKRATELADARQRLEPKYVIDQFHEGNVNSLQLLLENANQEATRLLHRLVVIQEDIDWHIYHAFGLTDLPPSVCSGMANPDDRPFRWAGSEPPTSLDDALRQVWQLRRAAIDKSTDLRTIESLVFKRPWEGRRGVFAMHVQDFSGRVREACASWLLSRAEHAFGDAALTTRDIATILGQHAATEAIVDLCNENAGTDLQQLLANLCQRDSVPFLSAHRYTDTGLEKRDAWERTWDLQRREDAGEKLESIPVPPKYDSSDYRDPVSWRHRGKLDVPKERFISYPGCAADEDGEPVYGWAGWNHLQQAQALATLYQKRRTEEDWKKERLVPLLAGLLELIPWVKQWHNEPNDEYGGLRLGEYFETFLDAQCRDLGVTRDDLRAWRPEARGRRKEAPAPRPKPLKPAEIFASRPDEHPLAQEALFVLAALTNGRGGRISRQEAIRAVVLLFQPDELLRRAPRDKKALAKAWHQHAAERSLPNELFVSAETILLQNNVLRREAVGATDVFLVWTGVWKADQIHAWYHEESKLALDCVTAIGENVFAGMSAYQEQELASRVTERVG